MGIGDEIVKGLEDLTQKLERGETIEVTRVQRHETPDGPMHTHTKMTLDDAMRERQFLSLGIPPQHHALAQKVVEEVRAYNSKQVDPDDCYDVSELLKEVVESPDYFYMEGGSDGTAGHAHYRGVYGGFPSLSALGAALSEGN